MACVTPFDKLTRTGPLALGRRLVPLRVIATIGTEEKPVNTNSAPSADAEEICKLLEQAVLKYFPGPIENVDTFLFANCDESAVGDPQSACAPGAPSNHTCNGQTRPKIPVLCVNVEKWATLAPYTMSNGPEET